jgi:type I protein arginine methyltransferase
VYSIQAYGKMLTDVRRMTAYQEAIGRVVRPESIVLDIGTGTGIHALMAARAGAQHVYAIEPADAVLLAREVAQVNGLADRITFIQDFSTNVTLPERADVVVSDLHGTLPWYQRHVPTIVDARTRLAKNGAIFIPQRDLVRLAAVEAPELHAHVAHPWTQQPFGFDFGPVAARIINTYLRGRVGREGFLSEDQVVAELDYRTLEDPNVAVTLEFSPARVGVLHGFIVWFDTSVLDDVRLTSAPFEPEISYGSSFFPVAEPVHVAPSDVIRLAWGGTLQGDDYVWAWSLDVIGCTGVTRASFRHNSLAVQLPSMERLRKRAPSYRPTVGSEGAIDRLVLNLMNGERNLEEIAHVLRSQAPDALESEEAALDRVRSISERYA